MHSKGREMLLSCLFMHGKGVRYIVVRVSHLLPSHLVIGPLTKHVPIGSGNSIIRDI